MTNCPVCNAALDLDIPTRSSKPVVRLDARGPLLVPFGGSYAIPLRSGVFFTEDGDDTIVWNFPIVPLSFGMVTAGMMRNDPRTITSTLHRGLFAYDPDRYMDKLSAMGLVPHVAEPQATVSTPDAQPWLCGVDW